MRSRNDIWSQPPGGPVEGSSFITRRFPFLVDQPVFPLVILFILNAVDEFDRVAFVILAPEIRDAFGLSNTAFGVIVGLYTVLILIGGLPVGLVGDRFKRTPLVVVAAALWGSMTVLTGFARSLWMLIVARVFGGTGRVANETLHTSLLTDYYPREIHGRVFGVHRAANPVGSTLGPLFAGILATLADWRWAFFVIAIPTVVTAAFATRLKEPLRGATEDKEKAEEVAKEAPIPLARAWRWLFSVPTLKRFYTSWFFGGGAIFALVPYVNLFYEEEYAVGSLGRGLIGAATQGVAFFIGAVIAGAVTDRIRRRSLGRVSFLAAMGNIGIGLGVIMVGLSPVLWVAILGGLITYISIGLWYVPNTTVMAAVLPARVRSLGIGVGVMFSGLGGFVFTVIAGVMSDGPGLGAAVTFLGLVMWVAAAIYLNAVRYVSTDAQRALAALDAEAELRKERLIQGARSLVRCRDVDVSYNGVQVLFGVDFEINEGEIVALLGTNGAGKSTLLKAISGIVHPVGGAIFFQGENVTYYEPHETAAAGIVQVPGGRGVFPGLTVEENLRVAAWLLAKRSRDASRLTAEALEIFPGLKERRHTKAGSLSGGEQQMLALAQAVMAKPKLLMIDELSLGLAPVVVEQLLETVRRIHARGTTLVIVEQSATIALKIAQRAYFMEKGEVRFSGAAEDLAGRTDLLRSVFLEGAAREGNGHRAARPEAVCAARPIGAGEGASSVNPVILAVDGLGKSYGGITAVDDVSFDVKEGQILGLIGPNGAGKTTIFDLISGFTSPDAGRVLFRGEDVTSLSAHKRARRGFGRSFQHARLFPSLTVAENLAVALERHLPARSSLSAALSLPHVRLSERRVAKRADELVEQLGLIAYRDKFVSELSTGTRRIVDLACSVAHRPTILILDEPSSGIAQAETRALADLLLKVRNDIGCTLLVIEHDMPLVTSVADELIALDLGRLVARGSPRDVIHDPLVVASYLGAHHSSERRGQE
ncbi:MAG TPA: MFS transporter [Actinomycetota bacterium]|nr:MFS transporter [Actinomycetota bacterium]